MVNINIQRKKNGTDKIQTRKLKYLLYDDLKY